MNLIAVGAQRTMSSRELASISGKRHDNVMRVCRDLKAAGVCPQIEETPYVEQSNGQTYHECQLNQRDSYVAMARLSPEFTAALVDRWQELEASKTPALTLPNFTDPAEAAIAWAAQFKAAQSAQMERDAAIRTKALIGSKREATAMATASAARREASKLRDALGVNTRHATITAVQNATGANYSFMPLRRWCKENGASPTEVPDSRYGTVKAWPAAAWMAVHAVDLSELFSAEVDA